MREQHAALIKAHARPAEGLMLNYFGAELAEAIVDSFYDRQPGAKIVELVFDVEHNPFDQQPSLQITVALGQPPGKRRPSEWLNTFNYPLTDEVLEALSEAPAQWYVGQARLLGAPQLLEFTEVDGAMRELYTVDITERCVDLIELVRSERPWQLSFSEQALKVRSRNVLGQPLSYMLFLPGSD